MALRTVRLDDEAEAALAEIVEATGLPMSAALKKGLSVLRDQIARERGANAFAIYSSLDLGPGGYAVAPSSRTREGVREAIRKKLRR